MKILVTAATSQTGSLAARGLVREGYTVRCLVRGDEGLRYLPLADIEIARGDLERPETLRAALDGMDAVAHIAHIRFAPRLIAACEEGGIRRVVFFSSTRRYTKFDCLTARQVRENEAAIEASDLDYTILRPSMIYGSERDNNISRLVRYLRRHRLFPLIVGGKNLVQPVFVLDVVDALLETLKRSATIRAAYTLAGPEPLTYRAMVQTLANVLERSVCFVPVPLGPALLAAVVYGAVFRRPRLTSEQVRRFAEDRSFDISAARRDLGYTPTRFEDGIRRQIARDIDAVWATDTAGS